MQIWENKNYLKEKSRSHLVRPALKLAGWNDLDVVSSSLTSQLDSTSPSGLVPTWICVSCVDSIFTTHYSQINRTIELDSKKISLLNFDRVVDTPSLNRLAERRLPDQWRIHCVVTVEPVVHDARFRQVLNPRRIWCVL